MQTLVCSVDECKQMSCCCVYAPLYAHG